MKWPTFFGVLIALGACASERMYKVPVDQAVGDYIASSQLEEVRHLRKGNSDGYQYLNDRYIIYRGGDDYLVEFRTNCGGLNDSSWVPADYIHDHRNLRAGEDTIRGCIVEKIYPITNDQRKELRHLGETPGQRI